jgi:hypothetical protein
MRTQHNDTGHNDTKYYILSVLQLSTIYAECCYAESRGTLFGAPPKADPFPYAQFS